MSKLGRATLLAAALTAAEFAFVARRRGSWAGANIVVRCRSGHLFTTLWVPGASLKAVRLGLWRVQRCPVGAHWTLVTPVRTSTLTPEEQRFASEHHDLKLP